MPFKFNYGRNHLTVTSYFFIFYFFILFYLFLAALGLRCRMQAFSNCGEQGLLFIALCRLLTAVVSLVAEHGF